MEKKRKIPLSEREGKILLEYARILKKNGAACEEGELYELQHGDEVINKQPASKWFQLLRIFIRVEELRLEDRLEKPWEVDSDFWKEGRNPYNPGPPWWEELKDFYDKDL